MSNISPLDLLDSRPLLMLVVELLRHAVETANASNAEWFVGGATAPDIMLTHVHGIEAVRPPTSISA